MIAIASNIFFIALVVNKWTHFQYPTAKKSATKEEKTYLSGTVYRKTQVA
jgi:hypothetical protein